MNIAENPIPEQLEPAEPRPLEVVVIGAGIVGISCALYLQRDGHRVCVVDPLSRSEGTSSGNAGILAYGHVTPTGMPGILRRVPGMLVDPHGPLVLRWRYLPRISLWLWHFLRASRRKQVESIAVALAALLVRAEAAYGVLIEEAGAADLVRQNGWLKVYASERGFARTLAERELMSRRSIKFEVLNADEIRQLEPALAPIFVRGLYQPNCALVLNPKRLLDRFRACFLARGGCILREAVKGFGSSGDKRAVFTDSSVLRPNIVIVAAGAWSRNLAYQLGSKVPLDTERGYHLMLPHPQRPLFRPTHWGEHFFGLAPLEHGLRLTSGVEFAGLKAPPDYRRVLGMLALAQRMLPGLANEPESLWLGFRPSLPDSLPVLGPSPHHAGVYFAFGHQHLGLTLGPVTGRIIADLVAGRECGLDLSPYRADRW